MPAVAVVLVEQQQMEGLLHYRMDKDQMVV
jgi:hypothetical protein